jgi:hypothetical protein
MVEIRVAVDDDANLDRLTRRLAALFGQSAISFERSCNEVRIVSEWGSAASWVSSRLSRPGIDEDGGKGARLSIGEHSYMLTGQLLLPAGR